MTTVSPRTPELERLRRDAERALADARSALDRLDPAAGIAALRTLRSILWRAEHAGYSLEDLAPPPSTQGD